EGRHVFRRTIPSHRARHAWKGGGQIRENAIRPVYHWPVSQCSRIGTSIHGPAQSRSPDKYFRPYDAGATEVLGVGGGPADRCERSAIGAPGATLGGCARTDR